MICEEPQTADPAMNLRTLVLPLLSATALAAVSLNVSAQAYRCEDAQGNVSFQQLPCPGKTAEQNQVIVKDAPLLSGSANVAPPPAPTAASPPDEAPPPAQGPAMRECTDAQGRPYFRPRDLPCGHPDARPAPGQMVDRSQGMPPPNSRVGRRIQNRVEGLPEPQPVVSPDPNANPDDACAQVKAQAEAQRAGNRNLTFDQRRALDDRVYAACKSL